MAKVSFNVDAYTARLIGRQNVSTIDGALLELVKNAYDADAQYCILYYEKSTDTLFIADNGTGMTDSCILDNWMSIGHSAKKDSFITKAGRVQTGAKGIGRFSLDRLASNCHMLTKTKTSNIEWIVNWESFVLNKNITDTYAEFIDSELSFNKFVINAKNPHVKFLVSKSFATGTIFKLNGIRDNWNNSTVKKIRDKLTTAIPPGQKDNFKIYFFEESDDFKSSRITSQYVSNYDYKIKFNLDEDGFISAKIHRNEFDFHSELSLILKEANFSIKDKDYFSNKAIIIKKHITSLISFPEEYDYSKIGTFNGEIYFHKISANKKDKEKFYYKDFTTRRNMRDRFGGIKIYRDNFRVRPYGEYPTSNYDWLLLDHRKHMSPASPTHPSGNWRVSASQILGQVYISRLNKYFEDQSNREGIIETEEFRYFREIIIELITFIEEDRVYVLKKLDTLYRLRNKVEQYENEIKERSKVIASKSRKSNKKEDSNVEFIELEKVNAVIEQKEKEIENLEDENKMLRTLATTGIIANTYIHDMRTQTHLLGLALKDASIHLKKEQFDKVSANIEKAREIRNSFNEWFRITLDSVKYDRRRMRKNCINDIINNLIESWNKIMADQRIELSLIEEDIINTRCFPHEIESIINNLIVNSISSYKSWKSKKTGLKINIAITSDNSDSFSIVFEDNGPGLIKKYKARPSTILVPFETSRRNSMNEIVGTGMGMWIVDKTIKEYGGSIDLSKNISSETGFHIKMIFKK